MATTRREFLRASMVGGLAAAAVSLPAWEVQADQSAGAFQRPKDPARLSLLETLHWPKLRITGTTAIGEPYNLMIQVGQEIHPMTPQHHIEWVEVWAEDKRLERVDFAEPTWVKPLVAVTLVYKAPAELKVRVRCNLDGLWENSIKP